MPKRLSTTPKLAGSIRAYDHVVFAIHCDWEGEIMFVSEVESGKEPEEVEAGEEEPK